MNTLPDRSVTHVGKLYCHLCTEVQQLIERGRILMDIGFIKSWNKEISTTRTSPG